MFLSNSVDMMKNLQANYCVKIISIKQKLNLGTNKPFFYNFSILMGCYLKMYCAIRGSQAWNSNDSRIAKRMALLVFTDFICWAPIAFFALTAAGGVNLINLEQAKVFTIFILPLNSCCNPFLYAILTKQFKKVSTI